MEDLTITEMTPISIIVAGARGRMGSAILRLAAKDPAFTIVATLAKPKKTGAEKLNLMVDGTDLEVPLRGDLADCSPPEGCVLIDFTNPEASRRYAEQIAHYKMGLVCGTTGLSAPDHEALQTASASVPVLVASNMSLGVALLADTARRLAAALPDYDLEIVEMHHRHKKDAPSGTALTLAEAAAAGRSVSLNDVANYGRHGHTGDRPAGEIGIHALRGGDIVGDHRLIFSNDGECIEIAHRATSRDTFAAGALRAARFIAGKPAGNYTMRDVLGLA